MMRIPLLRYVREARQKDLGAHLLAISAQQLLCTAPLAVALGAVGKRLSHVSFAGVLTHVLSLTPRAEQELAAALAGSPTVSLSALLLNLGFAVVFGIGLAATLQRSLELIWRLPRAPYLGSTVRGVIWAFALPLMISAVVVIGRVEHLVRHHVGGTVIVGLAVQIVAIAMFVWWTQYLLLQRRVAFKKLWLPTLVSTAAIAAVIAVGRQMISGQIVPAYRAYGSVGIGIVLSAWMAIASSSSSVGLAVGAWWQLRRDERRSGRVVPPVPFGPAAPPGTPLQQPSVVSDVVADVVAEATP